MNRLLSILFFLICFSSVNIYAQHFSVGGGIPFNTSTETVGLNLRGYYNLGEHICFGPEISYFFSDTETFGDEEIETTVFEINFNVHYIFEINERLGIYPLAGFNYTREKEDITFLSNGETEEETVDILGLNIGGGLHVPFPKFTPFVEYEYIVGDLDEHIVAIGVFFNIGKKESSEED